MDKLTLLHNKLLAGIPIEGVSDTPRDNVPGTRRVDFLPEATQQQRDDAHAIADGFSTLEVDATKTTVTADGVDESIITCGLQAFDYRVWLNDAEVADGSVNDGSLDFSTTDAGLYLVELRDGYETGYIEIEATNG